MELRDILFVAAGGIAGALLRFGVSTWVPTRTFPWATLAVNLAGAFLIGLLMLPSPAEHTTRLLVVVGFLGAFTTLSTYSFETVDLWRTGKQELAMANMVANGLGGPLLALAGWKLKP
ncbi:MAG TPA: fluoride efflux transporter CrcB [Candidatus Thermoplasmatota archaeon]|nr:fluoride efflux transporter CrcB [Candidatus Thermoplasmatota archaeon]